MGKLVAAFLFFLGASGLAIHESRVPPPREEPARVATPVDDAAPARAIHDEVPPWVKYATPPAPAPSGPVAPSPSVRMPAQMPASTPASTIVRVDDGDSVDAVDRCPDQPTDGDDNDGCPELEQRVVREWRVEPPQIMID